MFKKIFLILATLFVCQSCFAYEFKNTEFFNNFSDIYLTQYINEALTNNHDLKATNQKVEQYRQQVKMSFAQELPSLSVGANYAGFHVPQFDNFKLNDNAFILPFMASYEPDFLLKNRDKTKSMKKTYEAMQEEEKAIYISLLSDVATNYINILEYDKLIQNQSEIVKITKEELNRTQKKFNQGLIDTKTLETEKQNYEVENNKLITLKKQEEIILNNFATLIGQSPENTNNIKRGNLANFDYTKAIPDTISSDVIFSRPDVLASERNLEKAQIDVRIARKEFLPRFNITGVWAFNTIAPGTFFSWQSSLAAIFAGATMDIFKGGEKIANLRLKKAKYEELFENYRQTDLNAVKEVNTSLCIIKYDTQIDKTTLSQLNFEKNKFNSTTKKYKQGVISYPEYLTGEKNILNIKQNKINTKTQKLIDYVTLYKATGGAL